MAKLNLRSRAPKGRSRSRKPFYSRAGVNLDHHRIRNPFLTMKILDGSTNKTKDVAFRLREKLNLKFYIQ